MTNPLTDWIFSAKDGVKPPGFLRRNPYEVQREHPVRTNNRRSLRSAARTLILSISLPLLAGLATPGWADDIDIYFPYHGDNEAGAVRNPNILFMLDNSGSMAWAVNGGKAEPGESRMDILKDALYKTLDEISGVNVGFGRFTKTGGNNVVSNAPIIFPITSIDTPMDDLNIRNISVSIAQSQDDAMEKVAIGGGEVSLDDPTLLVVSHGGSELNRELTMTVGNSQYQVSFEGRDDKTWTYHVTEIGDKDLNHWILGVANTCGDGLNSIVADTPTGAHLEGESYTTTDPQTGEEVTETAAALPNGIGWHTEDSFSSGYFSFTLDQDYPEGAVNVHIKTEISGDDVTSEDQIIGPNCASGGGGDDGGDNGSGGDDNSAPAEYSATVQYDSANTFQFDLLSVVQNNDGTVTWTYNTEIVDGQNVNKWYLLTGCATSDRVSGAADSDLAWTSTTHGNLKLTSVGGKLSFKLDQNYPAGMIEIKIKNQSPQQNDVILGPDCNGGLSRTHKWTQGSDVEYKISFKSYQNNTWTYHVERTDGNKKLDEVYFKMPTSCSENNIVTTTPTKDSFHNQKLLWDLHGNSSSGDFSFQLDGNYPAGTLEARIEPKDKGSQYFGIMGPANCDTEVTLPGNNDNSGGGGSGGVDSHSVTTSCTVANDDGQKMTICHLPDGHPENAHTIEISKSAWPAHMLAGDTVGACLKDHQDQLDGNDKKVTICHYPPGNPGNAHEITISKNALQKHLDHHNDTIGECDSGPTVVCPEPQIVGLRFQYVDIPKGATIKKASIDFKSAAAADGNATFTIKAENSGNAEAFVAETGNISDRNTFADSVTWDVGSWDSETSYSTPDLAPLVENIVGHANWCGGKNLAFIISGSSDALHRVWSYDGDPNAAPKLNVEFESPTDTSGGNGCINQNYFGKIVHQDDDAEETSIGDVYVTTANNALDLGSDDDGASRTVGFRFRNVPIRKDATIVGAHLILHAQAGDNSDNASFDITGELEPNSEPFAEVDYNVTSRLNKPTSAVVNWPVATPWDDNKSYQSPDIKAIVQELVQQADWNASTNSMTLVLTGTGQRKVFSYEGGSATAATLHIQIDGYLGDNNTRTYLKEQVQNMIPGGWTPIVNALYESAIYFRGGEVTYGLDRQNQSKHLVSHPDTYTHVAPLDADTPKFYRDPACHFETDMFHYKCKTEKITVTASSKPFYNSPIATSNSPCQSNHIVLLTDGQATRNDAVANVENMIGSCATDVFNETPNEKCGIELAKFLYENDQYDDPDDTSDDNADKFRNNVTVHTIGFALKQQHPVDYLKKIAEVGGGSFHEADDVVKLQEAFTSIVVSAMEESTSFAPAGISLNRYNRLVHNNEVYYALFKPAMTQTWRGNVKKYKFAKVDVSTENSQWCDKNTKAAEGEILCLVDQNEKVAVKEQYINPDAQSFWSPNVDGANVVKGGAGEVLLNQTTRHILTDLGTPAGTALVDLPSDLVQLENAGLTGTDTNTETLRNWILGTDENNNPRNWLMSEPLHSSPQAMSYKAAEVDADGNVVTPVVSKVFFGANDGMLRMIDSETGQEEWAFLPQELFGIQAELMANGNDFTGESHIYGIDGTPVFWVNDQDGTITPSGGDDFVRLYVGMRRGGRNIYALDVTGTDASPGSDPRLMWVIKGGQGDFVNLGQTWSSVQPKKVHPSYCSKVDNALLEKDGSCVVLLFGGGYDEAQDDDANFGTPSSKGNAIYMVHAATGQRLWWASSASDATKQLSHMDYPIPAKLTVLDINGDSWVDRIYVGDVAGQVWRVDLLGWGLDENHQYQDLTLADRLAVVSSADESNYPIVSATGNGKRRFFASAEWIKTAVGDVVAIGSGTRPNPRNEEVTDRFYVFLDEGWQIDPNTGENLGTLNTLGETDLVNMTTTLELAAKSVLPGPDGEKGWYIEFTDSGEKALGNSVIIKKGDTEIVFFTTYAPPQEVAGQCDFQAGKSKLYALNLLTSAPAYDKDDNGNADTDNKGNDLADRSFDLKGGMPSDISLLYTDNEVSPLVGTERFVGDNDRQVKQTFWLQDE